MTCDDYFEYPERNASHLEECASCRVLADPSGGIHAASIRVDLDALPLASWEGASHRTWPLVATGISALFILAVALFVAAGTPPIRGIAQAIASGATSFESATKFFNLVGTGLQGAPAVVHVTIAVLFLVINAILFLLLRRAPRGVDV